jgi:hypothetical protein
LYDHEENKHCLSGVGQILRLDNTSNGEGYVAPREPGKAFIGKPARDDIRLTKVYTEQYMGWWTCYSWGWLNWRDLPLGVHMSCWKVAQLILGPSIEDNLELFATIALQNAREAIKHNEYLPIRAIDDWRGKKCFANNMEDLEKRLTNKLYSSELVPALSHGRTEDPFREINDPYRIHVVKRAIARSKNIKRPRFTCSRNRPKGLLLGLPPELLYYQILDLLTCKELSGLEIAMQIAIPNSYWRRRAAEYLVEMDDITDDEESNINWQYLSTEIEAAGSGRKFNGRRHVVDILRGIKPRYLQNLNKRAFPCLKDLIYRIQDEVNQYFLTENSFEQMLEYESSIANWVEWRHERGMPC